MKTKILILSKFVSSRWLKWVHKKLVFMVKLIIKKSEIRGYCPILLHVRRWINIALIPFTISKYDWWGRPDQREKWHMQNILIIFRVCAPWSESVGENILAYSWGNNKISDRTAQLCIYCWSVFHFFSVPQNIFLISHRKHMLWILKSTVSMRRFVWAPKTCAKIYWLENIYNILCWKFWLS